MVVVISRLVYGNLLHSHRKLIQWENSESQNQEFLQYKQNICGFNDFHICDIGFLYYHFKTLSSIMEGFWVLILPGGCID